MANKINWVELAKKRGFLINGVSCWVCSHNLSTYKAAKYIGCTQSQVWKWLHTPENKISRISASLIRVLNGIDARGGDSLDYL